MLDPILYTLMGFTTGTIFGGMAALSVHKARFVDEEHASMNDVTRNFWKKFTTGHEFGDLDGLPVSEHDHAFWLGYKAGHKVVAVKAGTMHFIGTTPTLRSKSRASRWTRTSARTSASGSATPDFLHTGGFPKYTPIQQEVSYERLLATPKRDGGPAAGTAAESGA